MSRKLILAGWLTLFGQLTFAQRIDSLKNDQDVVNIEQVSFTQSKIPINVKDLSKQVQIISKEDLAQNTGKDLAQILNDQAGILITGANGNPGASKSLFIRGASNDYALILIDGVPIKDPSGVGGAFDLRLLSTDQIERIEILKGSQSTMYGSDAISGVVNIITKTSDSKKTAVTGSLSTGSFNTVKGNIGASGKLKKVEYLTSYSNVFTEGISDAINNTGASEFDKDGYQRQTYFGKLKFNPTKNISISPTLRYSEIEGKYDGGAFSDANNSYKSKSLNPGVNAAFVSDKWTIKGLYNFQKTDREFTSYSTSTYNGRQHTSDVFASYAINKHYQVLGGVYHHNQQMLDTTSTINDPSTNTTSPYLSLLVKDLHGVNIEFGTRLNSHSKYGTNYSYTIAPAYWIRDNIKVFASYSTGYKAPTLSQLYGKWGPNEDLNPQESATSEVGLKTSHFNNKLKVELVGFKRDIKNVISYSYAKGYFNQDKQADFGGEATTSLDILKNVNIKVSYSYTDGEISTKTSAEVDTSFYNLIRRPKHAGSFNINYKIHKQFTISVDGLYVGDRIDNFFDPNNFWIPAEVNLKGYLLLNTSVAYTSKDGKLSLYAHLKNLGNVKYAEIYGYSTPKFNFLTGIKFKL